MEGLTRQVAALASELRPASRPAFLRAGGFASSSSRGPGVTHPEAHLSLQQAEDEPEDDGDSAAARTRGGGTRRRLPADSARRSVARSSGIQATLQQQRDLQESLTDELSEMASSLKRSAQDVQRGLAESMAVLDSVESTVALNLTRAQAASGQALELHAAPRAGFCHPCTVLLAVGILFSGTYGLIRFTS